MAQPTGMDRPTLPPEMMYPWLLPLHFSLECGKFWMRLFWSTPETDRNRARNQLPVPDVLQQEFDHDLFA